MTPETLRLKPDNAARKRLMVACPICGTEFTTTPAVNQRFCSKTCADAAHTYPRRKCLDCGATLAIRTKGELCRVCTGRAKAVDTEQTCKQCRQQFMARQWKVRQGKAKFCSRQCVNEYQKTLKGPKSIRWDGGKDRRRGVGWRAAREWALVRANNCCENCGREQSPGILNVHHIKPYRFCQNDLEANSLQNLIVLCRSCHAKEHRLGEIYQRNAKGQFTNGPRKVVMPR